MGVTIHFEGKLKNAASFRSALALARKFCKDRQWPCQPIKKAHATLERVRDEEDWNYVGPTNGLQIQPHEDSEPFRLEFDNDLYVQEYCKTQFAPIEAHVQLVELLNLLKPLFESLEVVDEGEYFETGDRTLLNQRRDSCREALDAYLSQSDKNSGPIRLASGRIVDVISPHE